MRDHLSPEPVLKWLGGGEPSHYLMGVPARDLSEPELAHMVFAESGKTITGPEHPGYEGARDNLVSRLTGAAGGRFYHELTKAEIKRAAKAAAESPGDPPPAEAPLADSAKEN